MNTARRGGGTSPSAGLRWRGGTPYLGVAGGGAIAAPAGATVRFRVDGPRSCVGRDRRGGGPVPCRRAVPIDPGASSARCARCDGPRRSTAAGRRALYLAWHGGASVSVASAPDGAVGDAAAATGALLYLVLGTGDPEAIRARADRVVDAGADRPDRVDDDPSLWWGLDVGTGAELLTETAVAVGVESAAVESNVGMFGVDGVLPLSCSPLLEATAGDVVVADVTAAVGRWLLLFTRHGSVLVDTGLLAGWRLRDSPETPTGLRLGARTHPAHRRFSPG